MGDIIIFTWDYFKKDLFKNTILFCCIITIPILSYNNLKKSKEIENLTQNHLTSKESLLTNHQN